MPGYFTPSEAFTALKAGAHALKLFPAEAASPAVVKAQRAVLPAHVPLLVVGGITPSSVAAYLDAGADGFGLGSALYRPGQPPHEVRAQANAFVTAVVSRRRRANGS
jgi:2-dehydro-3-deoxyphosphogalactonate aldolase